MRYGTRTASLAFALCTTASPARLCLVSRSGTVATSRLVFLIPPSLSITLLNRCKWIDIPISLFSYKCITFEDSEEVIPVFSEITISCVPEVVEACDLGDRLKYITNPDTRRMADDLIKETRGWDTSRIVVEPTEYDISLKISGRVFSYIGPRRKHFVVYTYDTEKKWTGFPISQTENLEAVKVLLEANVERPG